MPKPADTSNSENGGPVGRSAASEVMLRIPPRFCSRIAGSTSCVRCSGAGTRAPLDAGDVPVASLVGLLESSGYRGWYEDETLVRIPRDRRLDMLRASREWFEGLS